MKKALSKEDDAAFVTAFVVRQWAVCKKKIEDEALAVCRKRGLDPADALKVTESIFQNVALMAIDAADEQAELAKNF